MAPAEIHANGLLIEIFFVLKISRISPVRTIGRFGGAVERLTFPFIGDVSVLLIVPAQMDLKGRGGIRHGSDRHDHFFIILVPPALSGKAHFEADRTRKHAVDINFIAVCVVFRHVYVQTRLADFRTRSHRAVAGVPLHGVLLCFRRAFRNADQLCRVQRLCLCTDEERAAYERYRHSHSKGEHQQHSLRSCQCVHLYPP